MGVILGAGRVEGDAPSALAELQLRLLQAALAGTPLPGGAAVQFPDRAYLEKSAEYLLLGEHLARPMGAQELSKPLRVVTEAEALEQARTQGEVAVLRFQNPVIRNDEIVLVLEGVVIRGDGAQAPLSSVQARFVRQGGQWVAEPPAYLAG
jgi:hypothetical protein